MNRSPVNRGSPRAKRDALCGGCGRSRYGCGQLSSPRRLIWRGLQKLGDAVVARVTRRLLNVGKYEDLASLMRKSDFVSIHCVG